MAVRKKAVDHPLYFLLHDEPNPEMTSFVFRETLMTHLLFVGGMRTVRSSGMGRVRLLHCIR